MFFFISKFVIYIFNLISYADCVQIFCIRLKKLKNKIYYQCSKQMKLAGKFIKSEKALYEEYLQLELINHLSCHHFTSKYVFPIQQNNPLNNRKVN